MRAELKPNYDNNRKKLSEIIPLSHPFTVYIEQTRYCNFKCFYCIHSTRDVLDGEFQKLGYSIKHMEFDCYKEVIKQLGNLPRGIKRIVFSGLGEPLMNPRLPEMVKIASDAKIADRIEIITNGILLTPNYTDRLVEAGITNINISIQGINKEQYDRNCGTKIDFDRFVNNIKYLYNNKCDANIYIKIIDVALKNKKEEEEFFRIFGDICDKIYIEHLIVMQQEMTNLKGKTDLTKNFYNEDFNKERKVCSPSFYILQIGCDLDIFPCPNPGLPKNFSIGNMKDNSLVEIWNGAHRKNFLRTMMELRKDTIPICKECTSYHCITSPLEDLDTLSHELIDLFK